MLKLPRGPFCQSCGMPLSRDDGGGGTRADGTKTLEYCSHCYRNGRFTQPRLTLEQMIAKAQAKLRKMGVPELIVRRAPGHISKLERWQTPRSARRRAK